MTEELLLRADFYFTHRRFEEAEKEYRNLMTLLPDDAHVHCRLAICCAYNDKLPEGQAIAANAISLNPEFGYTYYICSFLAIKSESWASALGYVNKAIALELENAEYYGLKANIHMHESKWNEALDTATQGLSFDPENLTCINARTTALTKLNRKSEANDSIREALNFDPNDAHTHTNVGWSNLENGDHKQALEHFRMALSIDPNNEYARSGIIESMKARSGLYRLWLKYVFWISNMNPQVRSALFIGVFVLMRILSSVSDSHPALNVIVAPIITLYLIFAFSSWIVTPISNLILRLNRFGRFALSEEETRVSNMVGISLLVGFFGFILWLIADTDETGVLAIVGLSMMIPLSAWYHGRSQNSTRALRIYTVALGCIGALAVIMPAFWNDSGSILFGIYAVGFILFTWIFSGLIRF